MHQDLPLEPLLESVRHDERLPPKKARRHQGKSFCGPAYVILLAHSTKHVWISGLLQWQPLTPLSQPRPDPVTRDTTE